MRAQTLDTVPASSVQQVQSIQAATHTYRSDQKNVLISSFSMQVASDFKSAEPSIPQAIQDVASQFESLADSKAQYRLLLQYAKQLPQLDLASKTAINRVMGCTSEVWMTAWLDKHNRVQFAGDSNSDLTRGLCAVLVQAMSGMTPQEVLQVKIQWIELAGF